MVGGRELVSEGDFDRARSQRHRAPSFFTLSGDQSTDPFEFLLGEITGDLGKGIGDLLQEGKGMFDSFPGKKPDAADQS